MDISLNPSSPVPLFRQLHDQIVFLIARGDVEPGTRLAPVRTLAKELKINPATVVKAYDLLKQENLLSSRERGGSVVMSHENRQALDPRERLRPEIALLLASGCSMTEIHSAVDELAKEFNVQAVRS